MTDDEFRLMLTTPEDNLGKQRARSGGATRGKVTLDTMSDEELHAMFGGGEPVGKDAGVALRATDIGLDTPTSVPGKHRGMRSPGNVDLTTRPDTANPDGSHSSVRSMSFQDAKGGPEILIPTVADDGRVMTEDEAIAQYKKSGKHLGQFDTPDNATAYADLLHRQQAGELNNAPEKVAKKLAKAAGEDAPPPHPHTEAPPPAVKPRRGDELTTPDPVPSGMAPTGMTPAQVAENKRLLGVDVPDGRGTGAVPATEVAARGAAQGGSLGWGDTAAAAVDTAVSKIPGVRDIAQAAHDPRFPALTDPSVPFAQRQDAYRTANAGAAASNPSLYRGAEAVGSVGAALAGAKVLPKGMGPVGATAVGAGTGAIAGGGYSNEEIGSSDFVRDIARGGVVGAGAGLGSYGLGKYALSAPAKLQKEADKAILGRASGPQRAALLDDATGTVKPDIRELHASIPELHKAARAGDYQSMIDLSNRHLSKLSEKTRQIYDDFAAKRGGGDAIPEAVEDLAQTAQIPRQAMGDVVPKRPMGGVDMAAETEAKAGLPDDFASLDKTQRLAAPGAKLPPPSGSKPGALPAGTPPGSILLPAEIPDALASSAVKQLQAVRDQAAKSLTKGGGGAQAAYVNKLDEIIERIGPGGKLDAKELRKFMTEQVGVKPGEANIAPRAADAQNDAYFVLRDKVLHPEIKRVLGDKAAAELETANAQISRWKRVQDAALQQQEKTAGKEGAKSVTGAPFRALNTLGRAVNEKAQKALATDTGQRASKAHAAVPGAIPAVSATPGAADSHPIDAAMELVKNGARGTAKAYDYLFGPRGKDAGGYDPNRPGGP